MLGHATLDKQGCLLWIDASSQPVNYHLPHRCLDYVWGFVMGGECVPIGHKEKTGVLGLQLHPVF